MFSLRLSNRWRRASLVAVSVVAHIVVLGSLAARTLETDRWGDEAPPLIFLEIEPRPLLAGERLRAPPASAARLIEVPLAGAGRTLVLIPNPRLEDEADDRDPRLARPAPGAPLAGADDPWRVQTGPTSRSVSGSLRNSAVGCDMRTGRMSAAEQQLCDDRFGERAGRAAPISGSGDARRDARFAQDGARAMAIYESRRRPPSGGTGVTIPDECVGSNFGQGCAGDHLEPHYRQNRSSQTDDILGRDRRDPNLPTLPPAPR